jgi:cytochrome c oxidase subunit 3
LSDARYVVEGANLKRNEYGSKLFADFFSLSPVHGFHVLSGVIINIIIFNVLVGTYEKRGSYEMVEIGLYWHFVDLVWVLFLQFSI